MNEQLIFLGLAIAITWFSIYKRKLTISASLAGVCIAMAVFAGVGLTGVMSLGCFFLVASFVTSRAKKINENIDALEIDKGPRDIFQVLANGGIAGILGIIAIFFPAEHGTLLMMIVCSLSAATADTVSSELGSAYGKRFYNVVTFKKDARGENGVISFEGLLFGIAGSCVLAVVFTITTKWDWYLFFVIVIAGTIGNLVDSILGATLERDSKLGNNQVNFLNTIAGAFSAWLLLLY